MSKTHHYRGCRIVRNYEIDANWRDHPHLKWVVEIDLSKPEEHSRTMIDYSSPTTTLAEARAYIDEMIREESILDALTCQGEVTHRADLEAVDALYGGGAR